MKGTEIAFGPGKAELLATVAEAGTLAEAARQVGMSYMRAWKLLQTMNASFHEPLAVASRGGAEHGRVQLTDTGRRVLALYQEMDAACRQAAEPAWRELVALLAG
jgi:molybdate transport system regulatory protein